MVNLSVRNFAMIGIMAVLFILVAKVVFNKYPVSGVSDVVNTI